MNNDDSSLATDKVKVRIKQLTDYAQTHKLAASIVIVLLIGALVLTALAFTGSDPEETHNDAEQTSSSQEESELTTSGPITTEDELRELKQQLEEQDDIEVDPQLQEFNDLDI